VDGFGFSEKEKQLDERKLCSFLLNLKSKYVHFILAQILKDIGKPLLGNLERLLFLFGATTLARLQFDGAQEHVEGEMDEVTSHE
jgi:hypothetical protein